MTARTRRRRERVPEDVRIARVILPEGQARNGVFVAVDISNHSDDDQRRMVRSGDRRTIRRRTRVEQLKDAGYITFDQMLACEWFVAAYELGYQTAKCTANYTGMGGGGSGSSDLLAHYKAQAEARENYRYARSAIPENLLGVFELVTLGECRPPHMMSKADRLRFSQAAWLLHGQIAHLLAIAA